MPPANANDPLHTTDHVPNAAQAGPDVTTDHAPDSPRSDRATAMHLPGPSVKLKGTEPKPGPGSVSIPGYEIEEVLGRGGMGVVYKARHLALKRTVALKLMLAGSHAGPRELARFRIEAEAVARLQHPNIVQIHEVGEADGHPYCALEFVAGGNLASKLGGKPLPAKEASKLVEALAWAMQLAHSRNVVHRDLKPANILLTADGTPKITDFGLARQLDSDSGETQAGQVMGTPSYMAPEQASGHANEAGPAADTYALGAILYACLTGRPPFQGKTVVETLDQVRTQEPAPPSRWQAGVPLDLETICLKCLRKEPEKRYASAAELADDLVRYQRGEPILARPVGRIERAVKWVCRNPVVAGAAAVVVLTLAVATPVSILKYLETEAALDKADNALKEEAKQRQAADQALGERNTALGEAKAALGKANDERARADNEARQAIRDKQIATKQRDRAELLVCASKLAQAQMMWKDEKPVEALGFLDDCQWNLRGWEHRHLWTLCHSNQATLRGHTSAVSSVAWGPDGKRILSASWDRTLKVWDADKGQELLSLKGDTGGVRSVAWSPDGKRILSGSDDAVRVWDAGKGQELLSLKGHTSMVSSVSWSPDGKRILSGSEDSTLKVRDAATGQELLSLKGHTGSVTSVSWSPDGKRILSGSWDNTLKVWDAEKGQELLSLKGHTSMVSSVAWRPDGKRILSGSQDSTLKVWDADQGQEILSFKGHTDLLHSVAWSPDGKRILSGSADKTLKVWDAATGQELLSLKGHTSMVSSVAWSPDGKRILSGSNDKTLKVWDAATGQELLSLKGHTGGVFSGAWSPDGKRIVSSSMDNTLKVWDAATGHELLSLKGTDLVRSVAWSPDGKRIVNDSADNTLKVWDAATRQELLSLKGHTGGVFSVAWSPDGKRIVSGSGDNTLKVWDAKTGYELLSLKGHTGLVISVSWSPDGKRILSGSQDSTLKVWDADKEQELFSLKGHTGLVESVAFSLDGKRVSGKDRSGKVLTWNTVTGQLLPVAEPMPQEPKAEATRLCFIIEQMLSDSLLSVPKPPDKINCQWAVTGNFVIYKTEPSPDGSLRAFIENGQLKVVRPADFIEARQRDRLFLERLARAVPGYHYEKADLYEKSGDRFASAFHLRRLLEVRPSYAVPLLRRSPFNQREDSGALGEAALDAAIVQEPNNAALWLRRGLLRSRQGIPQAQADLDRAIELSRADPTVLLARALLEARAGRPAQACSLQEQALRQTALPALDAERGWERRPRTAPLLQGPATDAADTALALEEELGWERRAGPLQVARALAAGGSVSGPWPAALTLALGPRPAQETAPAWRWCGLARCARGEWGRAIHNLDAALTQSPGDLVARRCRARAHAELLQWDRASADCTTCLKVQPDDWELWYLRALAYSEMDRPDLALSDLTRALAQGNGRALREALPDFFLKAAQFAYEKKRFAAAMWLWADALASDPKLGDDREAQHRFNAARAAALAAAGQGKNEPPLDDAALALLRRQALDWLKAELQSWTKLLESGQSENIAETLSQWQTETDLAGVRDTAALAKLPAEEEKAFTRLWADVASLLQKAREADAVTRLKKLGLWKKEEEKAK